MALRKNLGQRVGVGVGVGEGAAVVCFYFVFSLLDGYRQRRVHGRLTESRKLYYFVFLLEG